MQQLIAKYQNQIYGVVSGFDRLVMPGSLRRVTFQRGMEEYLWHPVVYVPRGDADKEKIARSIAAQRGIRAGLVVSERRPREAVDRSEPRENRKAEQISRNRPRG